MLNNPAYEMIAGVRQAEAARVLRGRALEQVGTRLQVIQRHIEMRARSRLVGERFWHHRREEALFAGVMLGHVAKESEAVAHRQGVGVAEVELVLAVGVLMVE